MHDEEIDKTTIANEETRAKYLRLRADLLKRLATVNAVLDALREEPELHIPTAGAGSPTDDIIEYLTQQGKPCHQRDIIKAVGDKRKEKYPHTRKPYGNVWKSLQINKRLTNREVVCVELKDGKICRGELKPKPKQRRIKGGRVDRAEFYASPDNLFWLRDRIED